MDQVSMTDIATVSAVVAALVTVIANTFKIDRRYRAMLAIGIASVLWFIPRHWSEQVLVALIIGLTASGVYSQVKPRDNENELLKMQFKEEMRKKEEKKIEESGCEEKETT
ncbi:hypothetical protein GN156_04375 [bacterium LRH843]|nr:hypothetical protein [bacterium LRH843]